MFDSTDEAKSLEAEIMDFADDITFAVHDTEDFYRAGLIPLQELGSDEGRAEDRITEKTAELVENIRMRWDGRRNEEFDYEHLNALKDVLDQLHPSTSYSGLQQERIHIKRATSVIIANCISRGTSVNKDWKIGQRRVVFNNAISLQIKVLKELVWAFVIDRPSLALQQAGHKLIIDTLFDFFEKSADDLRAIPLQFHGLCKLRNKSQEGDPRLAADIICSLTDSQALRVC